MRKQTNTKKNKQTRKKTEADPNVQRQFKGFPRWLVFDVFGRILNIIILVYKSHISIYHIILLYKISYYGQSPACLVPKIILWPISSMSSTQDHIMANLQHVQYPSGRTFGPINGYKQIKLIQYGRILVPFSRNWSHMVGFGPKNGQQKSKNIFFPKCLKMVWKWFVQPLGVPGTVFIV